MQVSCPQRDAAHGEVRIGLLTSKLFWSQRHGAPCACGKVSARWRHHQSL